MQKTLLPCFAEYIPQSRKKSEIAAEMRRTWQTVYMWLSGRKNIPHRLRPELSEVAGLPPDFDWQRYEIERAAMTSPPATEPTDTEAPAPLAVDPPAKPEAAPPAPRRLTAKPPAGWPQSAQPSRPLPTPQKVAQPHQAGGKSASAGFFGFGG
ncbi:hypothetical protein [Rhodobacter capsulatus]|uniref:hypothetical protein n=1 Tax=Rhodobacter capsulatus TaxID=1061 RepID=UPI004025035A